MTSNFNKPEISVRLSKRSYQPTSKEYIERIDRRPLAKYESMPAIIKTPKQIITTKSRSVSLSEILIEKCTSTSRCLTCVLEAESTKVNPSNYLDYLKYYNENLFNRLPLIHDIEFCGFSSEWIFQRKYYRYIKPSGICLPRSEDSTISEKSTLNRVIMESPYHIIQSFNEMQASNKKIAKNILDLKNEEHTGVEENSSNDEYTVASYSESLDSSEVNVSEEIGNTKDDETLLMLNGETYEKRKKLLTGFNILGIMLPESKAYSEQKLLNKVCSNVKIQTNRYIQDMANLSGKATDKGVLELLDTKPNSHMSERRTASDKSLIANLKENVSERKRNSMITGVNFTERENSQFEYVRDLLTPESEIDSLKETLYICDLVTSESQITPLQKCTCKASLRNTSEMKQKTNDTRILALLEGKTSKQKQNILKALAMLGIQLPKSKSFSNENLIKNIHTDVSLPSEPRSSEMLKMHDSYADLELLQSQSSAINENILSNLHKINLSILKYYTNSEISLANKQKVPFKCSLHHKREHADKTAYLSNNGASKILMSDSKIDSSNGSSLSKANTSQEIRDAKYQGVLLLLEGESPKRKEKILHELSMLGIQLPERKLLEGNQMKKKEEINSSDEFGTTLDKRRSASEKKISDKIEKHKTNYARLELESPQLSKDKTLEKSENILKMIDLDVSLRKGHRTLTGALANKIECDLDHPALQLKEIKNVDITTCKPSARQSYLLRSKSEKMLYHEPSLISNTEKASEKQEIEIFKTAEQNGKNLKEPLQHNFMPPEKSATKEEAVDKSLQHLKLNVLKSTLSPWSNESTVPDKSFMPKAVMEKEIESFLRLLYEKKNNTKQCSTTEIKPSHESPCSILLSKYNLHFVPLSSEKMQESKEEGLLLLLQGETPRKKEKILKGLALLGIPLPEGKTYSEQKLIDRVRVDLGLPPTPKTVEMKKKYALATVAGLLQPLEGKSQIEKENILRGLADMCIPLPKGRTHSEKALIDKIVAIPSVMTFDCSAQIHKGSIKSKAQHHIITKCEPSNSECAISSTDIASAVLLSKTSKDSLTIQDGKLSGLFIPLANKSPEQKQMIFKELAIHGIMLPESKTNSDKKLIMKVRKDLGLPPEPQTAEMREKYEQAAEKGMLWPLEGRNQMEKEKILRDLVDLGIPLPKGRSASERALISRIKSGHSTVTCRSPLPLQVKRKRENLNTKYKCEVKKTDNKKTSNISSATPCSDKKQNILKDLAIGIVLSDDNIDCDKKLIHQVYNDPLLRHQTSRMKEKYEQVACKGLLKALEGKTSKEKAKISKGLADIGIPLPNGRCCSEQTLVNKIETKASKPCQARKVSKNLTERGTPVSKYECAINIPCYENQNTKKSKSKNSTMTTCFTKHKVKCDRLLTSLENISPEKKQQILKELAFHGVNLPEGNTASDKKIIDKVRSEIGLPPTPQTAAMRDKYELAAEKGLLQPLNGKTLKQKEKILKGLINFGIPLPKGRCASERALITKIKARLSDRSKPGKNVCDICAKNLTKQETTIPKIESNSLVKKESFSVPKVCCSSERPLELKKASKSTSRDLIDFGTPLHKGCCASETTSVEKAAVECECEAIKPKGCMLNYLPRRSSETWKISDRMQDAKDAGFLTPLQGKTPEQKYEILKGLATLGINLPEGETEYDKDLINLVRYKLGLPPEPQSSKMIELYKKAETKGLLKPLDDETPKAKEKIIKGLINLGIPPPKGRTASEIELINKFKPRKASPNIKQPMKYTSITPTKKKLQQLKKQSKESLTCLDRQTRTHNEELIVKCESPPPASKILCDKEIPIKARCETGTRESFSPIRNYSKAHAIGIIVPLEGKTTTEKKAIIQQLHDAGIHLTEGRTPSKALIINEIKKGLVRCDSGVAMKDKKICKEPPEFHCPMQKCSSEKKRKSKRKTDTCEDLDLPSLIKKNDKALTAGIIIPLEGKTTSEKKRILQQLYDAGIGLPVGRTCSEQIMINEIKAQPRMTKQSSGLLNPLISKALKQKDRVMKGLSDHVIPTMSDSVTHLNNKVAPILKDRVVPMLNKKLSPLFNDKIVPLFKDKIVPLLPDKILSLLPSPKTSSSHSLAKGYGSQGMLISLKGKTSAEKKKILQQLQDVKCYGKKNKKVSKLEEKKLKQKVSVGAQTRGYKNNAECGKMMKGITDSCSSSSLSTKQLRAKNRFKKEPCFEAKTPSLIAIYNKPPTTCMRVPSNRQLPMKNKQKSQEVLQTEICPEKRSSSEDLFGKCLSRSLQQELLTPLYGKTVERKEEMLKDLVKLGFSLPIPKTPSEIKLLANVRRDIGLPPEPDDPLARQRYELAQEAGIILPLEGRTSAEKKKILQQLHNAAIPLPEARTPSEEIMIKEIQRGFRFCFQSNTAFAKNDRTGSQKAARLTSYLENKTLAQTEIIAGSAFSVANTISKELLTKIKREASHRAETKKPHINKYDNALNVDIILPFESNTTSIKTNFLQQSHHPGIPAPKRKTPLEEFIVNEIQKECQRRVKLSAESQTVCDIKDSERENVTITQTCSPLPVIERPSKKRTKQVRPLTLSENTTTEQKEKTLKDLLNYGFSLPIPKTTSEKQLIANIRRETGLPPEPESPLIKNRYEQAQAAGIILPLDNRTHAQKKKILQQLHNAKIPLPVGRTFSEKLMITEITKTSANKNQTGLSGPSCPLQYNIPVESKKILQKRRSGTALTKRKTNSRDFIIDDYKKGIVQAALCCSDQSSGQAKMRTSFDDELTARKEKLLKNLLYSGFSLPISKTPSEKFLLAKIRFQAGLPPEPECPAIKERYCRAQAAGIILPLEGRTFAEKIKILHRLYDAGISLPAGRTPSEEAIITMIKRRAVQSDVDFTYKDQQNSAQCNRLTKPTESKVISRKEKILKELLECGFSLPVAKTISEKQLLDKVKYDTGLLFERESSQIRSSEETQATETIYYTERKSSVIKKNILQRQNDTRYNLPKGRTSSEKLIIEELKQKSIQVGTPWQQSKVVENSQILTHSKSQTDKAIDKKDSVEYKDKLFRCGCGKSSTKSILIKKRSAQSGTTKFEHKPTGSLSDKSLPYCSCKPSKKVIINKINKPKAQGLNQQTEEKPMEVSINYKALSCCCSRPSQKSIVNNMNKHSGQRLTREIDQKPTQVLTNDKELSCCCSRPSQKSLINKVNKLSVQHLTQRIEQKSTEMSINYKALSCCCSRPSRKSIINKISNPSDQRLSQQILQKPTEVSVNDKPLSRCCSKPSQKSIMYKNKHSAQCLTQRTEQKPTKLSLNNRLSSCCHSRPSQKSITNNNNKHSAQPRMKQMEQKPTKVPDNKKLSSYCLCRPSKMHSQSLTKQIQQKPFDKVRREICLPHESKETNRISKPSFLKAPGYDKGMSRKLNDACVCQPKALTQTSLSTVNKNKDSSLPCHSPSRRPKAAEGAGIPTLLDERTTMYKEHNLKRLVKAGLPLPIGKTPSEKKTMDKIRCDCGLPPVPKTPVLRKIYKKAQAAGLITPLEGKTPSEKKKILQKLCDAGIPLPEGRTPSEESMINTIKACLCDDVLGLNTAMKFTESRPILNTKAIPQKVSYMSGQVSPRLPSPVANTSAVKSGDKIALETESSALPKTLSSTSVHEKVQAEGITESLKVKPFTEKKSVLQNFQDAVLALPKGMPQSEKGLMYEIVPPLPEKNNLISRFKNRGRTPQVINKSLREKEMRKLASQGLPLPETKTRSDQKLADKIRKELGLPPEPRTSEMKIIYEKGFRTGIIKPLEGLTPQEKEYILRSQISIGIPLPKGRTPSEKLLIARIKRETPFSQTSSKNDNKDRIIQGLADVGIYIPLEEKSSNELQYIQKNLASAGYILPEYSSSPEMSFVTIQEQRMLKDLLAAGIPLPDNLTPSEKRLIKSLVLSANIDFNQFRHALSAKISNTLHSKSRTQNEKEFIEFIPTVESRQVGEIPSEKLFTYHKYQVEMKPLKGKILQKKKKLMPNVHEVRISSSEKEFVVNQIQTHFFQSFPTILERDCSTYKLSTDIEALKALEAPLPDANSALYENLAMKNPKELSLLLDRHTTMNELKYKCAMTGILKSLQGLTLDEKKNMLRIKAVRMPIDEGRSASETALATFAMNDERLKLGKIGHFMSSKNKAYYEKDNICRGVAVSELRLPINDHLSKTMLIGNSQAACRVRPSSEIDTVHQAKAKNFCSNISGMKLDRNKNLLKTFYEPKLSSTKVNTITDINILNKIDDNLKLLETSTPLENAVLTSDKSRRVKHSETIKFVKCGDKFHNYNTSEFKLKEKQVKVETQSPEIALFTQSSKIYIPEVPEQIIFENDGIKLAARNTVNVASDSLCSTESLLVVLKTDITHFNSLADESDSYCPTECNASDDSNESELCLKVTKYYNSTDETCSASSSSVDLNPRITIYFSSQTNSNLTYDTCSGDTNNSYAIAINNDSSTNTQYFPNKSADAISRTTMNNEWTSSESYKYNIKSKNANKTVKIIYSRCSKQSKLTLI